MTLNKHINKLFSFRYQMLGKKVAFSKMTQCSPLNNYIKDGCTGGWGEDPQTPIVRKRNQPFQLISVRDWTKTHFNLGNLTSIP